MSSKKIFRAGQVPEPPPAFEGDPSQSRIPARLRDPGIAESMRLTRAQEVLDKAQAQARDVLADAQQQAHVILTQAMAESAILRERASEEGRAEGYQDGYAAGHAAGYAEGLAAGRAELLEHLHVVYQLADEAVNARATVIAGAEDEILELIIEIARKVIGEVIDLNPEVAVNIVANAIKHANTGEVLTIRVNPRDVELLREYWAEALGDNPGNHRWEILADRRVKPGGCVIDTQAGSVDAQIDTQLVQIKYAFDRRNADESGG